MKEVFTVNLDTMQRKYATPKWVCNLILFFSFVIHLSIGLYLNNMIYQEILHASSVNPVATAYYCILALCCFLQCGLPIDKIANVMKS